MQAFDRRNFAKGFISIFSPATLLILACIASQAHFTAALGADRKGEVEKYEMDVLLKLHGNYTRLKQICSVYEVCTIRINDEISAEVSFVGEDHLRMSVDKFSDGGIVSDCCYFDTYGDGITNRLSMFINQGSRRYTSIYSEDYANEKRSLVFVGEIYLIVKQM